LPFFNLILIGNLEFTATGSEESMASGEETDFLTCSNCSCLAFRCCSPVASGHVPGGTVNPPPAVAGVQSWKNPNQPSSTFSRYFPWHRC